MSSSVSVSNVETILSAFGLTWEELTAIKDEYLASLPEGVIHLIGSREWIARERAQAEGAGRVFVATKALRREYARLDDDDIRRVNDHRDTVLGKAIHPRFINYIELVLALRELPDTARWCWILYACEGKGREEIAIALDMTVNAVDCAISRAASLLVARIFEPLTITMG